MGRVIMRLGAAIAGVAVMLMLSGGVIQAAEIEHFHPKGKPPSKHTLEVLAQARATLPFADKRDFDEEKKGFIAAPESWQIMANAGNVAWDMERYKFFLEGKDFDSIHPSLQRQGTLNMNFGLYEVMPGVYQVRGFDLANISFVKGKTGWIVFDPLTTEETARAALELVNKHLGNDGCEEAKGADCGRHGEGSGQHGDPRPARLDIGGVRPEVRDPAGDPGRWYAGGPERLRVWLVRGTGGMRIDGL
jgi:hypothetical protein